MNLSNTKNTPYTIQKLLSKLDNHKKYQYGKPYGSGLSFLVGNIKQYYKYPIIIVTHNSLESQQIAGEIGVLYSKLRVFNMPDWETLPYDIFSPNQSLISERLKTLYELLNNNIDVLVIPINAVINYISPIDFIASYSFIYKKDDFINEENLLNQFKIANYKQVSQVADFGEFCIRGSIIDIFPMGSSTAYRLDLLDNKIESIRTFNIETQCSTGYIESIEVLPGKEFPVDEKSINYFRSKFREYFEGDPSKYSIYKNISKSNIFPGIEYYLPLFFEEKTTIFDYLQKESLFITLENINETIEQFSRDTQDRYNFLKHDIERPILKPEDLFLDQENFYKKINNFKHLSINLKQNDEFEKIPNISILENNLNIVKSIKETIRDKKSKIIICVDANSRKEIITNTLKTNSQINIVSHKNIESFFNSADQIGITIAPINYGFKYISENLTVITENDLYPNTYNEKNYKKNKINKKSQEANFRDIAELSIGDPVVHYQYGVGRYKGLVNMNVGQDQMEFLHLEYAKKTNLYVPITNLNLISRYIGIDPENAPLHQLGSDTWEKKYKKAIQQIHDTAAELLDIYSKRALKKGHAFLSNNDDYNKFVEDFEFTETIDQEQAIQSVLKDMSLEKPMDRLVCGDVGFGKTEVALRASFIAVSNNKQVIILCPTTLLAEQHTQTFSKRFANWPIKISELSRMKSRKEILHTISAINDGIVDIIIGTHKILSSEIKFKNLGLVVIDEEHRFGVRQKEMFKNIRSEVDVLSLTATPIPRTLSMSLEGIRDFSIITTAPQKRLPIKTFIRYQDNSIIVEAIRREIRRGGQVYFLHNEISTIHNKKDLIEQLLPEIKVAIAHGQMLARNLENIMKDFCQKKYDVLLCTTIIENGIDIPNANTIIINRADTFGLAQLHQLRGRVGRSHHQAYAYLLIPNEGSITSQANKRLNAIQNMEDLGSGFYLALHDLEIRGSGEILGESQSGNIQEIGYSLYNEMLSEAIAKIKDGKETNLTHLTIPASCEINLGVSSILPSEYCPDISARLALYKRLSHAHNEDEILKIQYEIEDRFGKLPDPAENLIITHKLRILADKLHIKKLIVENNRIILIFEENTSADIEKIISLTKNNRNIKLSSDNKIFLLNNKDYKSKINELFNILNYLNNNSYIK
ncbi:transcription-repair coupling factor [Candidatus Kinetoplastidibacterium crithidiae]|uniref:Transcription-repair-coupling factor n=1 Tax=Candidatus Kinetoplastidibacterium crithidiae TCC036E TaxID=1208918 RepID=M1LUK2_9PROT|nr:transcription-repair coupling factor [Candidatus Kinetoplastibacterium crithidii]AFZ82567.1 transcription-repair coupling factor [Candidatus Kinetoplastibacterium crithidii (ex Angomonas deanei ATCC 30255)]AGF47771.1 superfamily II transcription-repair coupling factor [Candidatus Kinetoplastibacterium crithidii TCC036E]